MKVKAVIFKTDRNNDVVILSKKNRKDNTFTYHQKDYSIKSEHFVITKGWSMGWKRNFITFYYKEDSPKPLPIPEFPEYKSLGISPGELNAVFNPVFYRIIAASQNQKKLDYILYGLIGIGAISAYGVWMVMQLPEKILKLMPAGHP